MAKNRQPILPKFLSADRPPKSAVCRFIGWVGNTVYTRNKIVSNLCQFSFFEMQSRQKYFRMWKYIKLDLSDFKTGSIDLILRGIDFYVSNGDLLESTIDSIWVKMPQKYRLDVISASVSWFSFFPVLIFIRSGELSLFTHKKSLAHFLNIIIRVKLAIIILKYSSSSMVAKFHD